MQPAVVALLVSFFPVLTFDVVATLLLFTEDGGAVVYLVYFIVAIASLATSANYIYVLTQIDREESQESVFETTTHGDVIIIMIAYTAFTIADMSELLHFAGALEVMVFCKVFFSGGAFVVSVASILLAAQARRGRHVRLEPAIASEDAVRLNETAQRFHIASVVTLYAWLMSDMVELFKLSSVSRAEHVAISAMCNVFLACAIAWQTLVMSRMEAVTAKIKRSGPGGARTHDRRLIRPER